MRVSNFKFQISNSHATHEWGFTLIELIVVVVIIGVLFTALASLFNPFAQIEKAKNANRELDFQHIKAALDAYFNDTGCYPASLPFGSKWSSGTTIYMEKVPEDPDCSAKTPQYCYVYQTNAGSCPQWNILYSHLAAPIVSGTGGCLVATVGNCTPPGGLGQYNYCVVSGKLDCNSIGSLPTPTVPAGGGGGSGGGGSGGGGSGGGGSPTLTPIPTVDCNTGANLSACSNNICDYKGGAAYTSCYGCGGSIQCYPDLVCGGNTCITPTPTP